MTLLEKKKKQKFVEGYEKACLAYYGNSPSLHTKIKPSSKQQRKASLCVVK